MGAEVAGAPRSDASGAVCQQEVGGTFWGRRQRGGLNRSTPSLQEEVHLFLRPSWEPAGSQTLLCTDWEHLFRVRRAQCPRLHSHLMACCPFHHLLNSSGLSILALEIKALNLVISKDPGFVLCACTPSRSPWVVTETWRCGPHRIFSGHKIF